MCLIMWAQLGLVDAGQQKYKWKVCLWGLLFLGVNHQAWPQALGTCNPFSTAARAALVFPEASGLRLSLAPASSKQEHLRYLPTNQTHLFPVPQPSIPSQLGLLHASGMFLSHSHRPQLCFFSDFIPCHNLKLSWSRYSTQTFAPSSTM